MYFYGAVRFIFLNSDIFYALKSIILKIFYFCSYPNFISYCNCHFKNFEGLLDEMNTEAFLLLNRKFNLQILSPGLFVC